jgi:hypothetical protein
MDEPVGASIWDAIRGWADAAGLLLPQDEAVGGEPPKPRVPQSVCDNCPICQGAATLDQVNPDVFSELTEVARALISGVGSALSAAAEQRLSGIDPDHVFPGRAAADRREEPQPPEREDFPDDPSI